jgi:hypothetical protein
MLSSPVYAEFHPRPSVSHSRAFSNAFFFSATLNDSTHQHPNDIQTPTKACNTIASLYRQHRAPLSPLPATFTDHPASAANKRLTVNLTPLDATLTKNRGRGAPYLSLRSTKIIPALSFQSLTNCPFSIPFVLTFIHLMRGVPTSSHIGTRTSGPTSHHSPVTAPFPPLPPYKPRRTLWSILTKP